MDENKERILRNGLPKPIAQHEADVLELLRISPSTSHYLETSLQLTRSQLLVVLRSLERENRIYFHATFWHRTPTRKGKTNL